MVNQSPLEQLAAFAICFVAGAASVTALAFYTRFIRSGKAKT